MRRRKETVNPDIEGYMDYGSRINIDPDKSWQITLSSQVNMATVILENIYVADQDGNNVTEQIQLLEDGKTISIPAPEKGYIRGNTYTLIMTDQIRSSNGTSIKSPIKMNFTIDEPERSQAEVEFNEEIVAVDENKAVEVEESITKIEETEELNTKITYYDAPEEIRKLQAEELLMMAPTDEFPMGYLAKVKEVVQQGEETVIEYEQPEIDEVVSDLDIDLNKTLEKSPIVDITLNDGVQLLKEYPSEDEIEEILNGDTNEFQIQSKKDVDLSTEDMIYDKEIAFVVKAKFKKEGIGKNDSAGANINVNAVLGISDLKLDTRIKQKGDQFEQFKMMVTGKKETSIRFSGAVNDSIGLGDFKIDRFRNDNEHDLAIVKLKGIDRSKHKIPVASVTWGVGKVAMNKGDFQSVPLGLTLIFFINAEGEAEIAFNVTMLQSEDIVLGLYDYNPDKKKQDGSDIIESEEHFTIALGGSVNGKMAAGIDFGLIVGGLLISTVTGEAGINLKAGGTINTGWYKRTINGMETNIYRDFSPDACYQFSITPYFLVNFLIEASLETAGWFGFKYETSYSYKLPILDKKLKAIEADSCAPVKFVDEELEQAVRDTINKQAGDLVQKDVKHITSLEAENRGIRNLTGLEALKNLKSLNVSNNDISKMDPNLFREMNQINKISIANNRLTKIDSSLFRVGELYSLDVSNNRIREIDSNMFEFINGFWNNLRVLDISNNELESLLQISSLRNLEKLYAQNNQISSVSPLAVNLKLRELYLKGNPYIDDFPSLIGIYNRLRGKDFSIVRIVDSLSGDWKGPFTSPQGEAAPALTIWQTEGQNIHAVFDFDSKQNNQNEFEGSYTMEGVYNPYTNELYLKANEWVTLLNSYEFVELKGSYDPKLQLLNGKLTSDSTDEYANIRLTYQGKHERVPFGNLFNASWVTQLDDKLYYRDYFNMYQNSPEGIQTLYDTKGGGNVLGPIIATNEHVYVSEETWSGISDLDVDWNAGIYKMDHNGDHSQVIHEGYIGLYNVQKDWVYFTDIRLDGSGWDLIYSLHRMKSDGSEKEILADYVHKNFYMNSNQLYYYDKIHRSIFVVDLNTMEQKELVEVPRVDNYLFVQNGYIYYDSNEVFKRMNIINGQAETLIEDISYEQINMIGNSIYYTRNNAIYKMESDGTNNKKLMEMPDGSIDSLVIIDDSIYFVFVDSDYSDMNLYRMKLNGTSLEKVHHIFHEFG